MAFGGNQNIRNTSISNSSLLQVGGDMTVNISGTEFLEELLKNQSDNKLLNKLVSQELDICKKYILDKNILEIKRIISTFSNYGFTGFSSENRNRILLYKLILSNFEDEKNQNEIIEAMDDGSTKDNANFLNKIDVNKYKDVITNLMEFEDEVRIVLLDKLFTAGKYEVIISTYELLDKGLLDDTVTYYYGLSSFNVQNFGAAQNAFKSLRRAKDEKRIQLLVLLSEAQQELSLVDKGIFSKEILAGFIEQIEEKKLNDIKSIIGCELATAIVESKLMLFLQRDDYLEIYSSFSVETKQHPEVQFYLGQYYEQNNDIDKAIEIYISADWKHEIDILFRLMVCNLMKSNYAEICKCFDLFENNCEIPRCIGIWMMALKHVDKTLYDEKLLVLLERNKKDIEMVYFLSMSVEDDKDLFDSLFYKTFINLLEEDNKDEPDLMIRIGRMFISFGYSSLCLKLLNTISGEINIDREIALDFYRSITFISKDLTDSVDKIILVENEAKEINDIIKICEWFIERNSLKEYFLREKINYLIVQKKNLSALNESKKLYKLTKDENVATNIISLLIENKCKAENEFEYYIEPLKNSMLPRSIMAAAAAYNQVGKIGEARFHLYKAILVLNEKVDFDIYNSYLGLHHSMLYEMQNEKLEFDYVIPQTVVTLSNEDDIIRVCLDDEIQLQNLIIGNHSLEVIHCGTNEPLFLRLLNRKIDEEVVIERKSYYVKKIMAREVFAYQYILNCCIQNPENNSIMPITIRIKDEDPENILNQMDEAIKKIDGNRENTEEFLLKQYNFNVDDLGLPLETLTYGNYEKYFDVIRFLLYKKDQAFYAGNLEQTPLDSQSYILSLSTLAILACLGKISILDEFLENITIPKSLVEFVRDNAKKSICMEAISPGTMITLESGEKAMLPFDKSVVQMWNDMYEFCLSVNQVDVSDEERMKFEAFDGISGETLCNLLKLDYCQLDSLILVQKNEDAVFVCDDLFIRKFAFYKHIKNGNGTIFIHKMKDELEAANIIMELAKTNYIYVPVTIMTNISKMKDLWINLLDGKIKKKYYEPMYMLMLRAIEEKLALLTNTDNIE